MPILRELCGETPEKPFECVGSREEISAAMVLGIARRKQNGQPLPALLRYFMTTQAFEAAQQSPARYFDYYQQENLLPEAFAQRMQAETKVLKERFARDF